MDTTPPPSWRDYPLFLNNPVIQALAHEPRWTISTTQPIPTTNAKTGKDYVLPAKSPLDVRELLRATNFRGAWSLDEQCLMTLPELNDNFELARNNAFYLSCQIDEVLVLDIEPSCPEHIKHELLAMPSLYRERSMSGQGYHMVMPLPENFYEFPAVVGKRKIQHEERWYEILIDHWVTFTRDVVPEGVLAQQSSPGNPAPGTDQLTWEEVYAGLAQQAVSVSYASFDLEEEMPQIPQMDQILRLVKKHVNYSRTPQDFHNDLSKWEFGYLGHAYNQISFLLSTNKFRKIHDWSASDRTWLLYEHARTMLPHRDKHTELRNGMPFLLYVSNMMVAQRTEIEQTEKEG